MSLNYTDLDTSAATNVAHSKFLCISFCNVHVSFSNLNSVHHHLQFTYSHETKLKPLDPNVVSILSPHLKCPGFRLFSSFVPNGGLCAFFRSDVQTSHLTQFNLLNAGFQLIWLKTKILPVPIFLNSFALYCAPNSKSHELLYDYLPKSIGANIL